MVRINNLIRLHTLVALAIKKHHGYELIKEVSVRMGKEIRASHIYPFLKELKNEGYITIKETGDREKKIYSLTPSGKKLVKEVIKRVDDIVSFAVKNNLVTCDHCGCKLYSGEHAEIINGRKMYFCCCHCAKSYKKTYKTI